MTQGWKRVEIPDCEPHHVVRVGEHPNDPNVRRLIHGTFLHRSDAGQVLSETDSVMDLEICTKNQDLEPVDRTLEIRFTFADKDGSAPRSRFVLYLPGDLLGEVSRAFREAQVLLGFGTDGVQ